MVACRSRLLAVLSGLLGLLAAIPAGGAQRTFVSTLGSDAAACSIAAPCRSFGTALAATDTGGEIIVLDSGGYGPVTINKSVAIRAPAGIYAGVSVFANSLGSGIGIAFSPGVTHVTLEGLTIVGLGGSFGIYWSYGETLTLERVRVQDLTTGIVVASDGRLTASDTTVSRSAFSGVYMQGYVIGARVLLDRCRLDGNNDAGVKVLPGNTLHVRDSTFVANFRGVDLGVTNSAAAYADIDNTQFAENVVGVFGSSSGSIGQIRVSRSTLVRNTLFAIEAQGSASILSRGDNTVADNGGGETFTGTFAPK